MNCIFVSNKEHSLTMSTCIFKLMEIKSILCSLCASSLLALQQIHWNFGHIRRIRVGGFANKAMPRGTETEPSPREGTLCILNWNQIDSDDTCYKNIPWWLMTQNCASWSEQLLQHSQGEGFLELKSSTSQSPLTQDAELISITRPSHRTVDSSVLN